MQGKSIQAYLELKKQQEKQTNNQYNSKSKIYEEHTEPNKNSTDNTERTK